MSVFGLLNTSYFPIAQTPSSQTRTPVSPIQKSTPEDQQRSNYQYWQVQPNIRSERAVAAYEQLSRTKEKEQRVNQLVRIDLYA